MRDPKNIIELTKLDEDNELVQSSETAHGKFNLSSETAETINKSIVKPLPLPTYEMDHLRNALTPILNDKSNAILDELSRNEITFNVGIFSISITKLTKSQ